MQPEDLPFDFPKSLNFKPVPEIDPECKATLCTERPVSQTTITGQVPSGTFFVQNSGGQQFAFTNSNITFNLPTPGPGTFLDPTQTLINFKLNWIVSTAAVQAASSVIKMKLLSSAASFISSMQFLSNSQVIDTINNYDQIFNMLLNCTINGSSRTGAFSIGMGCDDNSYSGVDIPFLTAGTYQISFSLPILAMIGLNTHDQLFPIGCLSNCSLSIQTAPFFPCSTFCSAVPTTAPVFGAPTLTDWSLNFKLINIGRNAYSLLSRTWKDGHFQLKSTSYCTSPSMLSINANGDQSLQVSLRKMSLTSVFLMFSQAVSAATPNGWADNIQPALTGVSLNIPGYNKYPLNNALDPSRQPGRCLNHLMAALGSSSWSGYGGLLYRATYNSVVPSLPSNPDASAVVPAAGVRPYSSYDSTTSYCVDNPSNFYVGFDTSKVDGGLLSGIDTNTAGTTIELTLGVSLTSTLNMLSVGLYDKILVVDTINKNITTIE